MKLSARPSLKPMSIASRPAAARPVASAEPAWKRQFFDATEAAKRPMPVGQEGRIPKDVYGSHYSIGPGALQVHGTKLESLLDGPGMARVVHIGPESTFCNRFVETVDSQEEKAAGRMLFNPFGQKAVNSLWDRLTSGRSVRNAANTSIALIGERLYALYEGGKPYALDNQTLETVGEANLGILGALDTFSAHPRTHASTGVVYNFGVQVMPYPHIRLYRMEGDNEAKHFVSIPLGDNNLVHDFSLTETEAVFVVPPLAFPRTFVLDLIFKGEALANLMCFQEEKPTRIARVNLESGAITWSSMPSCMPVHSLGAFEENGTLHLDNVIYREGLPFASARDAVMLDAPTTVVGHPERITISPAGEVSSKRLSETPLEFPVTHPLAKGRAPQAIYGSGWQETSPMPSLPIRIDLDTGFVDSAPLAADEFAGESTIIAKADAKNDKEAYLLTLVDVQSKDRTELRVYDAANLGAGHIGALILPQRLPYGFHTTFKPARE